MSWTEVGLGEIFSVGSSKRVLKSQWQTSGVPFYRGREITKLAMHGNVDNELFISEKLFSEFKEKYGVPGAGDIVVTAIGTIGNSYIVKAGDRFYFKDASVLWLSKKSDVDSKFVNYWLQSPQFKGQIDKGNGATVDTLTIGKLKSARVGIPCLPEQKRIVAILNEAFAGIDTAIANTEKNLANARELFESYLNSVFSQRGEGWLCKTFSEVCEGKITDGTHQTPKYFDEGHIFLSSRNVTSGEIDWERIKYVDRAQHVAMQKRVSPRLGDILLAKNGTTGVAAIVDREVQFDIYVSLALLRPRNVIPRFLWHFINSPVAKKQFNKRLKGVGVPNLHLTEIRQVEVYYPENKESQERVVTDLDDMLHQKRILESIYQQKLTALTELKQSLLQKAFLGELTADPADTMATVEAASA